MTDPSFHWRVTFKDMHDPHSKDGYVEYVVRARTDEEAIRLAQAKFHADHPKKRTLDYVVHAENL